MRRSRLGWIAFGGWPRKVYPDQYGYLMILCEGRLVPLTRETCGPGGAGCLSFLGACKQALKQWLHYFEVPLSVAWMKLKWRIFGL